MHRAALLRAGQTAGCCDLQDRGAALALLLAGSCCGLTARPKLAADASPSPSPGCTTTSLSCSPSNNQTEDVFDDSFWEGLDVVVNALDNVNARCGVPLRSSKYR